MIKKTVGWGIRVRGRKKGITWGWGWVHVSFISNAFFISASTLLNFLMNRIWNVAELLLNKYRQNFTELLHIFSIFTSIRNLFTCLRLDLFVSFLPDLFFIFIFIIFFFFFPNQDLLHARLNSHYKAWGYKKKRHKKIKAHRKSV